jgi:PAS domain S-box-containing protein
MSSRATAHAEKVAATTPEEQVESLRSRLSFLHDVLRCLPVGLVVADEESRVVLTNPLGDEIRGVGHRIGYSLEACHPPRSQEALSEILRRLEAGEEERGHPFVVERGSRWEVRYSRVTGEDGGYRGVAWVAQDIGRQKELQRQLLHQERVAGLGRMAGRLAHEVKNSLNVLAGALHNLRGTVADSASREMLFIIDEQVNRLTGVIDQLRAVTRPLTARPEPCDVVTLVRAGLQEARCSHACDLTLDADPALPVVSLDPALVSRLLTNVLDNAARAAGPGGSVVVRLRLDTQPTGEWVVLQVEDDGPGFPREVLDHLFEPFVSTRPDGMGFGLVTMREVCRLHGGDVEIENQPGGGAVVTARLLSR